MDFRTSGEALSYRRSCILVELPVLHSWFTDEIITISCCTEVHFSAF